MNLIVHGLVSEGLGFVGPFRSVDDAIRYADKNFESYEIPELESPGPQFDVLQAVGIDEEKQRNDLIRVSVAFLVHFTVTPEELEGKTVEEQQEYLKDQADDFLQSSTVVPIIAECDRGELVE